MRYAIGSIGALRSMRDERIPLVVRILERTMPNYDYRCEKCGETFEVFQTFSDAPLKKHPNCGGKVAKVLSSAGFVLKGSGFYKNDSGSRSTSRRSKPSESASSTASSTDSSSTSKTPSDSKSKDSSKSSGSSDAASSKTSSTSSSATTK